MKIRPAQAILNEIREGEAMVELAQAFHDNHHPKEQHMKIRPAQAILNEIREGEAMVELAQAFHDAIANVREHGKTAVVNVTITVGTLGESQHKLVEPPIIIRAAVKTKLYEPEPPATVFFVDQD